MRAVLLIGNRAEPRRDMQFLLWAMALMTTLERSMLPSRTHGEQIGEIKASVRSPSHRSIPSLASVEFSLIALGLKS